MSFGETIKLFSIDVPPSGGKTIKRASFSPQVESPLAVDAVLGESAFSVTDDKVSITELRVHAVSGLTLSLQPSPGNSHTMVAKATGVQTLTTPKQVEELLQAAPLVPPVRTPFRKSLMFPRQCPVGLVRFPSGSRLSSGLQQLGDAAAAIPAILRQLISII